MFVWIRVYGSEPEVDVCPDFTIRNPVPFNCPVEHKPIEFFKLFMFDGFLYLVCRETNICVHKFIEQKIHSPHSLNMLYGKMLLSVS